MLRFQLGRIPVEIHGSFVLITALLAFSFAQPGPGQLWPDPVLRNPSSPDYGTTLALTAVAWALVITVSVLVHELGHALAARLFGYSPSVHLVGMGGLTNPNANEQLPWHRDVLFTAAGPAFGMLLALGSGAGWLLLDRSSGPEGARYLLRGMFFANAFWTVLNLLPVSPLDGGRIASTVLTRVLGRPGFLVAQVLALLVGGAVVAFGLYTGSLFLAVFFGMYLFRAVSLIQAYRRGELPLDTPSSPNEQALARAEALFREGKVQEAQTLATQLLTQDLQPSQRSRAHHVAGWVALKEGRGKEALEHFTRVQNQAVAPQALAAALSLVGEDERAIPLWHMAATTSGDLTLRHELAGALIRAGRESDARRLPEVRMALAFTAAERVLTLRGEHERAAHAAESAFQAEPGADLAYDAACAWARAGQAQSALRMLALASQNGFSKAELAASDPDLAPLRELSDFRHWLETVRHSAPA